MIRNLVERTAILDGAGEDRSDDGQDVAHPVLKLGDQCFLPLAQAAQRIDIGRGAEPFDNPAMIVAHRRRAGLVPAIAPRLDMTKPPFHRQVAMLARFFARSVPEAARRVAVVGMDRRQPAMAQTLLDAQPGRRHPLLADPGPLPVTRRGPDELRNPLDQGQEAALAGARCDLGPLCQQRLDDGGGQFFDDRLFALGETGRVVTQCDHGEGLAIAAQRHAQKVAQTGMPFRCADPGGMTGGIVHDHAAILQDDLAENAVDLHAVGQSPGLIIGIVAGISGPAALADRNMIQPVERIPPLAEEAERRAGQVLGHFQAQAAQLFFRRGTQRFLQNAIDARQHMRIARHRTGGRLGQGRLPVKGSQFSHV